jgi:hypothetical protein
MTAPDSIIFGQDADEQARIVRHRGHARAQSPERRLKIRTGGIVDLPRRQSLIGPVQRTLAREDR